MKGEQRSREQGLQVKRCLCAVRLQLFGLALKHGKRSRAGRTMQRKKGVTGRTRGVFQSCVFNHHRFCTGDCDEKGLEIPVEGT